jgi:hypothetical protein
MAMSTNVLANVGRTPSAMEPTHLWLGSKTSLPAAAES